jgi:hypothetical protein
MYVEDIINKLNKKLVRFANVDYYPAITVQDMLRDKAKESISWSVEDFENQAKQNCNDDDNWDQYYNKDMFCEALRIMIEKHDASIGISWDTVDYYLETYCSIKDYVEPLVMKEKKKNTITTRDLSAIDDIEEHKIRNR